jgi:hypothetical protein
VRRKKKKTTFPTNKMSSNSDVEEGGDDAYDYEYDSSSDDDGGIFQPPYHSLYNQEPVSCPICCEEKIEEGCGLILPNCRHSFCVECFTKYLETVVGQGNADDIKCPFIIEGGVDNSMIGRTQSCNETVEMDVLKEVIDASAFDRLTRQRDAAFVSKHPEYHHCPTPDCSSIVFCPFVDTTIHNRDSGDVPGHQPPSVSAGATIAPPRICDCFKCGKTSCLSCGVSPFHDGLTCAQYQHQRRRRFMRELMPTVDRSRAGEENRYDFELEGNAIPTLGSASIDDGDNFTSTIKRCRRCGNGIEFESGCLKMKCRCGYRFCFQCGSENAQCDCTPAYQ